MDARERGDRRDTQTKRRPRASSCVGALRAVECHAVDMAAARGEAHLAPGTVPG